MANSSSAEKRVRQNEKRRLQNKARKSRVKTVERKLQAAIAAKDAQNAEALLGQVASQYDKAAKVGLIHRNTASRKKSRLFKAVQRIKQG